MVKPHEMALDECVDVLQIGSAFLFGHQTTPTDMPIMRFIPPAYLSSRALGPIKYDDAWRGLGRLIAVLVLQSA